MITILRLVFFIRHSDLSSLLTKRFDTSPHCQHLFLRYLIVICFLSDYQPWQGHDRLIVGWIVLCTKYHY